MGRADQPHGTHGKAIIYVLGVQEGEGETKKQHPNRLQPGSSRTVTNINLQTHACVQAHTAHAHIYTRHIITKVLNTKDKKTIIAAARGGGKRYHLQRNNNTFSRKMKCIVGKASSGCFSGYERRLDGKWYLRIGTKKARYLQAMCSVACCVLATL